MTARRRGWLDVSSSPSQLICVRGRRCSGLITGLIPASPAAALIDISSLSVIVPIKQDAHFSLLLSANQVVPPTEEEEAGRPPSHRLLMALEVVTCRVRTFIMIVLED